MGAAEDLSATFAALADPTRRDIVVRLAAEGGATVTELAAPYGMSLQAVSKHVAVLEEAGLVTRTQDAQRRPVHLAADVLSLLSGWIERTQRAAEARYARLDVVLAELASHDDRDTGLTEPPTSDHPRGDDT